MTTSSHRLFDETNMYTYIENHAKANSLTQTLKVLPYAREKHEGQFRKGKEKIPYICHPLMVACHALALGLVDDNMVSAALLHDVCEDCDVSPDDLPVNEETKVAVALLTKTNLNYGESDAQKEVYYSAIAENPIATMVKLLDRCNNVSSMAAGFSKEKKMQYIEETKKWFYPLFRTAETRFPMYSNQIFLIHYHIKSIIETINDQL